MSKVNIERVRKRYWLDGRMFYVSQYLYSNCPRTQHQLGIPSEYTFNTSLIVNLTDKTVIKDRRNHFNCRKELTDEEIEELVSRGE
jgi:hypothetical protein